MLFRLRNAAASMSEMNRQQERTANNLANANTVGFQRDRTFTDVISRLVDDEDNPTSQRTITPWSDPQRGAFEATGNPLDVALGGEGFFVVTDAAGQTRYTRAGRLQPTPDGTLMTPDGFTIQGTDGPLRLPPDAGPVTVSADGAVRAGEQDIGALRTVRFAEGTAFERFDGATFGTDAEPEALDAPDVRHGVVETSNVNPMAEMTDMITHFRLFESQQKMLQTTDQALGLVTRDLGKF
ncbi:MAG: flagellar hook-basal body protein [Bacteroidota bacterium]